MADWLLVHPPLLGPAVLAPLAAALRRRGAQVAVPDLRGTSWPAAGWPGRWTTAAAAAGPADRVLRFSGAGVVLPAVARAVDARRVVWVDAVLPAAAGETVPSAEVRELVRGKVRGDRLAAWPTWWPAAELAAQLPDVALRDRVSAEAPELPADFYEVPVPVPGRWPDTAARYVQLSAAYAGDAARARARGWDVRGDGGGRHLDVATAPDRVADLVADDAPLPGAAD